ncbi:hypothetical protein BGLA2_280058 [Burkholderia gladioli]|nr:hypothetical protein BGLA2_280058 [Burkholderia gladioli]
MGHDSDRSGGRIEIGFEHRHREERMQGQANKESHRLSPDALDTPQREGRWCLVGPGRSPVHQSGFADGMGADAAERTRPMHAGARTPCERRRWRPPLTRTSRETNILPVRIRKTSKTLPLLKRLKHPYPLTL